MRLEGSCHCGAIQFSAESVHPYPYMWCYCSICRKTAGGGGYGVNIKAEYATLVIEGREHLRDFHATIRDPGKKDRKSVGERFFCGECGTQLWVWDRRWPEMFHPHPSTPCCRSRRPAPTSCWRSKRPGCSPTSAPATRPSIGTRTSR